MIVATGLYVLFADWGPVDQSFLIGPCVLFILTGAALGAAALIGLQGIRLMYTRRGVVSGHFMLIVYLCTAAGAIAAECWALINFSLTTQEYRSISSNIGHGMRPPVRDDQYISKFFNRLFFGASLGCSNMSSAFFWSFINNHCPSGVRESDCMKCYYFSPSQCMADQNTCYSSLNQDDASCPYMLCRTGILTYFVTKMDIIIICGVTLIAFQGFVALATLFLLLHGTFKIERHPVSRSMSFKRREEPPHTYSSRQLFSELSSRQLNPTLTLIPVSNSNQHQYLYREASRTSFYL